MASAPSTSRTVMVGLTTIRRRITSGATTASRSPTRPAVEVPASSPRKLADAALRTASTDHDGGDAEGPAMRAGRVQDEQQCGAAERHADELADGAIGRREDEDRQQDHDQDDPEIVLPGERRPHHARGASVRVGGRASSSADGSRRWQPRGARSAAWIGTGLCLSAGPTPVSGDLRRRTVGR